jgi:rod shape-determining protein MreD
MSTRSALRRAAAAPRRREPRALPQRGVGLKRVALMAIVVVILQITVMPYITVADGIPDLVVALVVSVAVLRGPLVGAVTGFACGFIVELTTPIGTLGVLALLYLAVGFWCGRFADRPEASTIGLPLVLIVAGAAFVQVGYALFQLLLGTEMTASVIALRIVVPTVALSALLAPPVLLVARRLLGAPMVVEPGMLDA